MVAFGITAVIGLQAAINIAVVTVSMPTKGIALPLISSGGTGWILNAAAIGVLMSIERVTRREAEAAARSTQKGQSPSGHDSRWRCNFGIRRVSVGTRMGSRSAAREILGRFAAQNAGLKG